MAILTNGEMVIPLKYIKIEDGQWINNDSYASLHLVASSGEKAGVFEQFCSFAKKQSTNLRIDTHDDNRIMQHCIEKQGFVYCGRIYVRGHSPRRAYQWGKIEVSYEPLPFR